MASISKVQEDTIEMKSHSDLIIHNKSEVIIKTQTSAPFYLNSLRVNEAPPFGLPDREPRPCLLLTSLVNEDDVLEIVTTIRAEPFEDRSLGEFLVKKKIIENFQLGEKKFLVSLILEVVDYAAQKDFYDFKLACLLTIYLSAHKYFKWRYWTPPTDVWNYFKELVIRHTIEDSPDGQEVFNPEECYDIITHFHTLYMSNLPLLHILTFGSHRIKLMWPFKLK